MLATRNTSTTPIPGLPMPILTFGSATDPSGGGDSPCGWLNPDGSPADSGLGGNVYLVGDDQGDPGGETVYVPCFTNDDDPFDGPPSGPSDLGPATGSQLTAPVGTPVREPQPPPPPPPPPPKKGKLGGRNNGKSLQKIGTIKPAPAKPKWGGIDINAAVKGPVMRIDNTYVSKPILPDPNAILVGRDQGTIGSAPSPDWAGESAATIGLIDELDDVKTTIFDAITIILNLFDGQPADPPYNIKATGSPQIIEAFAIVVANKIEVLLSFFTKYKTPPPGPSQALDNYNTLWQRLVNLENWYMLNKGSNFAPYPYTYPP